MKRTQTLILGTLLGVAGTVLAAPNAAGPEAPGDRVLRVFVHVDNKGEVTAAEPAVKLQPGLQQMLQQTLDQLISKPAIVDNKPAASQFVMDLAVKSTQRADGGYDASFKYLSSEVVPAGDWQWVRTPGREPVLVPKGVTDYWHEISTLRGRAQDPPYYETSF